MHNAYKILMVGVMITVISVLAMVGQFSRIKQLEADLELAQQVTESEDISGCR
jgi:hypothetical protein